MESRYSVVQPKLDNILNNLAEVTSLYPNIQNLGVKFLGYSAFEGTGALKKIRSYLIFINYSVRDTFWRFAFVENITRKLRSFREKETELYNDCYTILSLFSLPVATDIYIEERFPDKVSVEKMMDFVYHNILKELFISLVDNPKYIESKIRRKGYNDKGFLPRVQNVKPSYGTDDWNYNFIYNPDLVNKEGELIMNNSEKSLQRYLVELQTKSAENLLEYLEEVQLERRLFKKQTLQEIETIAEDTELSAEEKVERILKNERAKIKKSRKYLGKYFNEKGELTEVYSDSSREDKKALGDSRDISIQSRKAKLRGAKTPTTD